MSTAIEAFQKKVSPVVIDNTNTTLWEMEPYIRLVGTCQGHMNTYMYCITVTWILTCIVSRSHEYLHVLYQGHMNTYTVCTSSAAKWYMYSIHSFSAWSQIRFAAKSNQRFQIEKLQWLININGSSTKKRLCLCQNNVIRRILISMCYGLISK